MAVYENTVPGMQVIHSFLVYQLSGTGGYQEEEKGSKVFTLAGVGLPGLKLADLLEMDQLGSCKLGRCIDHTL